MPKLTPSETRHARDMVRERDGNKCAKCGKTFNEYFHEKKRDFDLHHVDANPANNPEDGSNWQLMCHPCNCKNDPAQHPGKRNYSFNKAFELPSTSEREHVGEDEWKWRERVQKPATMKKNEAAEPMFRIAVEKQMNKYGVRKRKDLLDECCESCTEQGTSLSQATGARYLDKMCSDFGKYKYDKDPATGEMIVMKKAV